MTEDEWLTVTDPQAMLAFLRDGGKLSERKARLFGVASCQRLLQKVRLHPWYAHGIAVAERFADGEATVGELEWVHQYPPADWCLQHAPRFDPEEITTAGQPVKITKLGISACWPARRPRGRGRLGPAGVRPARLPLRRNRPHARPGRGVRPPRHP